MKYKHEHLKLVLLFQGVLNILEFLFLSEIVVSAFWSST